MEFFRGSLALSVLTSRKKGGLRLIMEILNLRQPELLFLHLLLLGEFDLAASGFVAGPSSLRVASSASAYSSNPALRTTSMTPCFGRRKKELLLLRQAGLVE